MLWPGRENASHGGQPARTSGGAIQHVRQPSTCHQRRQRLAPEGANGEHAGAAVLRSSAIPLLAIIHFAPRFLALRTQSRAPSGSFSGGPASAGNRRSSGATTTKKRRSGSASKVPCELLHGGRVFPSRSAPGAPLGPNALNTRHNRGPLLAPRSCRRVPNRQTPRSTVPPTPQTPQLPIASCLNTAKTDIAPPHPGKRPRRLTSLTGTH